MRWILFGLVVSLLVIPNPVSGATQPTDLEVEIHRLINNVRADKERHGKDLVTLQLHSVLISVAREHSKDMLERDYFDHISPEGTEPADRVSNAGVEYSSVAENLFYATSQSASSLPEEAVDGWVNSPGHYQNIITNFKYTGIGIANSGDTYYVTQVFVNADPAHLENIGQIYENDNLDDITEDDSGFQLTAQHGAIIVILILIVLGLDAKRRNAKYYGRR